LTKKNYKGKQQTSLKTDYNHVYEREEDKLNHMTKDPGTAACIVLVR
jgi:hypothetical protein